MHVYVYEAHSLLWEGPLRITYKVLLAYRIVKHKIQGHLKLVTCVDVNLLFYKVWIENVTLSVFSIKKMLNCKHSWFNFYGMVFWTHKEVYTVVHVYANPLRCTVNHIHNFFHQVQVHQVNHICSGKKSRCTYKYMP